MRAVTHQRATTLATLAMLGSGTLIVGAALLDLGGALGRPTILQAGNTLAALSSLG